MENTKIAWATHLFSPWLGATWGPNGTRRRTAESTWRQVERWDRKAACDCRSYHRHEDRHIEKCPQRNRPRVFPSACDPFEDWTGVPAGRNWRLDDVRRDFFGLIDRCQNLDFLLLTKRPENVRRMTPDRITGKGYASGPTQYRSNVWLLYSASDQHTLEAGLPHLLACRDLVPVLGLSLEPLVGPVDLYKALPLYMRDGLPPAYRQVEGSWAINWVIVGGESGSRARPCDVAWIRSVVDQCKAAGVPCFVKQLGSNPVWNPANKCDSWPEHVRIGYQTLGEASRHRIILRDKKGSDPDEWPEDLRVMEFPHV